MKLILKIYLHDRCGIGGFGVFHLQFFSVSFNFICFKIVKIFQGLGHFCRHFFFCHLNIRVLKNLKKLNKRLRFSRN